MTPHQLTPAPTTRAVTTAERMANLVGQFAGIDLPVGIRAWDGTEAGPADGPVLVIKSRRALRRLLWVPTELGLARAYVCGDVDGDLGDGLRAQAGSGGLARHQPLTAPPRRLSRWPDWVRLVCRRGHRKPRRDYGAIAQRTRDRAAIAHHYDLSNEFYEMLLDEHMAYSVSQFTRRAEITRAAGLAAG